MTTPHSSQPTPPQDALIQDISAACAVVAGHLHDGTLPHLQVYKAVDTDAITAEARTFSHRFDHVFIVGTGGSRFGADALVQLKTQAFQNQKPTLHFLSNIDPHRFHQLETQAWPWDKTGILVISKSGATPETLSQLSILWQLIIKNLSPEKRASHIKIMTEDKESLLGVFAKNNGIEVIDHPHVGGRFSALTCVGLLPAAIAGCDIHGVKKGAMGVFADFIATHAPHTHMHMHTPTPAQSPPKMLPTFSDTAALGSTLNPQKLPWNMRDNLQFLWQAYHSACPTQVMFLYGDALAGLGAWYAQILAESTGKDGRGMTPLVVKGTEDQHSQLQLFQDGPRDKTYTFISLENHPTLQPLGAPWPDDSLFHGRQMSDVFTSCVTGTHSALAETGAPCRHLQLPRLDEESFGAFMAHMTIEVIVLCALLKVDAFNQPGVEKSKHLTQTALTQAGRTTQTP